MKKILKTVLVVVIVFAIAASVVSGIVLKIQNKPDYTFMIITDTHVFLEEQIGDINSEAYKEYDTDKMGKMVHLSECIYKSALDVIIKEKPDALLVSGDLADIRARDQHLLIASQLKRVQDAGIEVYVIPGNHDTGSGYSRTFATGVETSIPGTNLEEFIEIYEDFGYNQALVRDEETGSYVVNLNEDYALVAIDAYYSNDSDDASRRLIDWVSTETQKCVQNGRVPLGMIHFPILDHYGEFVSQIEIDDVKVRLAEEYRDAMIDAGMNYVFTGHVHCNDISSYSNENGTLYDIETAALANYPCPIKTVGCFKDKMEITTEFLDYINPDYIPPYISSAERQKILTDFQKYASDYLSVDFGDAFFNDMLPGMLPSILKMFGLDKTDSDVIELKEDIIQLLYDFAHMPIYKRDEAAGQPSLQWICENYGITIPDSDYAHIMDLVLAGCFAANYKGDENITIDSTEGVLFRYGLYSVFYTLADFDIFAKIHELNPDVAEIDLMPAMQDLFTKGELDIVDNDFIAGIISSLEIVRENDMLSMLIGMSSQSAVDLLEMLEIEIMELTPLEYISAEKGALLFGKMLDELVFGTVGKGALFDDDPPDNNIIFDIPTASWYVK